MLIRAYLRASTKEQEASRARDQVEAFATDRGLEIAGWYVESESGSSLSRPELFRLLSDSRPGDLLLIEQVDRLSRLNEADWRKLRLDLATRQIRVVALDLPTSWQFAFSGDEFTGRVLTALNDLMLDMLAAVARKDYEDRRRRQAQGQARAKAEGRYKGRPENVKRNEGIAKMLAAGLPWSTVQGATGASRATIAKISKRAPNQTREPTRPTAKQT